MIVTLTCPEFWKRLGAHCPEFWSWWLAYFEGNERGAMLARNTVHKIDVIQLSPAPLRDPRDSAKVMRKRNNRNTQTAIKASNPWFEDLKR